MAQYLIDSNAPNGIAGYSGGDVAPPGGGFWIAGPVTNDIGLMIYDSGKVRPKNAAELEADSQAELEKNQAQETAKQALEAVSPAALNQLAMGFTDLLEQESLAADTKQALSSLMTQAVACIGHLRDLVVMSMGGSRG
jgi:hypothetical protein